MRVHVHISLLYHDNIVEKDEEITDLETLLRQEREREKTQHQDDLDDVS